VHLPATAIRARAGTSNLSRAGLHRGEAVSSHRWSSTTAASEALVLYWYQLDRITEPDVIRSRSR
jgi:hypothetical protein